ncbi:hypothetical protein NMG60_11000375 [Bertholletia excelsa]
MFTEFRHISFLLMESNSETLNLKQDQNLTGLENSLTSTSELANGCPETASSQDSEEQGSDREEATDSTEDPETETTFLGNSEVAESDDGFRTPTSSDHKIPTAKHCPPPPKKPRIRFPSKRKASLLPPLISQNVLLLDLSKEVESMFPPTLREDLGRKIKRARREDAEKIGT